VSATPARRPALRCYYSLRSPYSWLSMRRLDDAGLGVGSRLAYVPFFEPQGAIREQLLAGGAECLYSPMSKARHRYILGDVKRLTATRALAVRWPVDVDVDWSVAHLVALACREDGLRRHYLHDAMQARWQRGEAIFDWMHAERLLAARVGAAAAAAIVDSARSDAVAGEAVAALRAAWQDDVFGVPLLVCGRDRYWGQDRIDDFLASAADTDSPLPTTLTATSA
jgi:2-hydroxychromene-2-carboxylate isomerase